MIDPRLTFKCLPSPGIHIRTGNPMRQYQIRAAHKIFTGTPTRDAETGQYTGARGADGSMVHVDMGLGKTVTALTAIVDWFRLNILRRPVLIIAPIKVITLVWRQEALAWTHTGHLRFGMLRGNEKERAFTLARAVCPVTGVRNTDVILCNPEMLLWLEKYLREDWSFFDALIIDDVSFRDPASKQFRALSRYGKQTALKDASGKALRDPTTGQTIKIPQHRFKRAAKMTGTPSPAGLHQLWAQSYLMDHGERLYKNYETFEGRFFHKTKQVTPHVFKVDINKEEAETRPKYQVVTGAPERIHEIIADVTIELNAADYGVLPRVIGDASKGLPPATHLHRVELPPELRSQYEQLEKEAILELTTGTVMAQNGGAKSMMCWQFCNGAIYDVDQFGKQVTRELHSVKLDTLVELIDRLNTNVMIPYFFKSDFERITTRLQKEGMAFEALKGNGKKLEGIMDRWNSGQTPILLVHPSGDAHGLNIQFGGHTQIWFTLIWSLDKYLQMLARLARSGQKDIVHVHHIAMARTTDDLMLANLRSNGDTQTRFREALREYQEIKGLGLYGKGI